MIFDNQCRIVYNRDGYYLNLTNTQKYFRLCGPKPNVGLSGSIWVKRPLGDGWCHIIHFYLGREFSIGFIKKSNCKEFLFKEKMQDNCFII